MREFAPTSLPYVCTCAACWWVLHPFKVVSVVRVATMTGRFSAMAKCTYPQCPEPGDEKAEFYMHRTSGTVYMPHPHMTPRSLYNS